MWSLPREVPERVVFSDTYLTRNLVAARAQNEPYWVLALAIDHATLWGGTNDRVEQIALEGFPHKIDDLDWDVEHQERVGNFPSVYTDERTHQFMREIDTQTQRLAGPPPASVLPWSACRRSSPSSTRFRTNHHTEAGRVPKGGLTQGPPHTLAAEIEPAREAYRTKQIGDLAQRIDAATGRRAMTSGLDEVWRAVLEGRVDTLVVEDGYRETVQVAENHLLPVPDGTPSNGFPVVDDIVDDIAERALDRGAQVYFVPDGELAERGHIAATLRF
ncbi:baeRF3 domain-containing protein [Yinghuangia aomiensis]